MPLEIPQGIGEFRLSCEENGFVFVLTGKGSKVSCTKEQQGSGRGAEKVALTSVPHGLCHYFNREVAKIAQHQKPPQPGRSLGLGNGQYDGYMR